MNFGAPDFIKYLLKKFEKNGEMLVRISPFVLNLENLKNDVLLKYFELLIDNVDFSKQEHLLILNHIFLANQTLQKGISGKFVETIIEKDLQCRRFCNNRKTSSVKNIANILRPSFWKAF